jgi:hypothetical protein
MKGTFRKHEGDFQEPFRDDSGNIQGTFREHEGNMKRA